MLEVKQQLLRQVRQAPPPPPRESGEAEVHFGSDAQPAHGRGLQSVDSAPGVSILNQEGAVAFNRGAYLRERVANQLYVGGDLLVNQDLNVGGSVLPNADSQNLDVIFTAATAVNPGDVVSLMSNGVAKGFGLQLSASVTSFDNMTNPIVVNMTGRVVVVVYFDVNGYGQAAYYDTTTAAPRSPVPIEGTSVLLDITAARVSDTTIVVCYRINSTVLTSGYCRAGSVTSAGVSFGSALTVTDSVDYSRGSVSGSFGDTDRFVLAFSSGIASPASKLLVVGVSGSTLTALTSGALEKFEASALADSISIVSLTRLIYVLTYRIPRDGISYIRVAKFPVGDLVNIASQSSVRISGNTPFDSMRLARVNDTRALLVMRNPNDNRKVLVAVADVVSDTTVSMGPLSVVHPGTQRTVGLGVSVAAVSTERFALYYHDAVSVPYIVDGAVYGSSIVLGSPQLVFRYTNTTATGGFVAALQNNTLSVVAQATFVSTTRGANGFRATIFGGPVLLGVVGIAASAGGSTSVAAVGSVSGFSGLRVGSPYYARYDGGIDFVVDETNGVSTRVIGSSIATDTLLLAATQDTPGLASAMNDVTSAVTSLNSRLTAIQSVFNQIPTAVNASKVRISSSPLYYYNIFSTHNPSDSWYYSNNVFLTLGVAPSTWTDGRATVSSISSNKDYWRNFFTKRGYGGFSALVWSEEWYQHSSTNGRVVGLLFRIRNITPNTTITWNLSFQFSSNIGYDEVASLGVNGNQLWSSATLAAQQYCAPQCKQVQPIPIPPNRVSSVMLMVPSGSLQACCNSRSLFLAFVDDSLRLPTGLQYVDDLFTTSGGFES